MNGYAVFVDVVFVASVLLAIICWRLAQKQERFLVVGVLAFVWIFVFTNLLVPTYTTLASMFSVRPIPGYYFNHAGDSWLTDPWRSFVDWPSLMQSRMWILLWAGLIVAVIYHAWPKLVFMRWIALVIGAVLIVLAALGIDWENPFASNQPANGVTSVNCFQLPKSFGANQAAIKTETAKLQAAAVGSPEAKLAQTNLDNLARTERKLHRDALACPPQADPYVGFGEVTVEGTKVHFRVATNVEFPEISYALGLPNVGSDYPAGDVLTLDREYPPSEVPYTVIVRVKDRLFVGRSSANSVTFTIPTKEGAVPVVQMPPPPPTATACAGTWQMAMADHANGDLLPGGVQSILGANSDQAAIAATADWLGRIRTDKVSLSGAARFLLDRQNIQPDALVDANGCASSVAADIYSALQSALADPTKITAEPVPSDARGSHIVDGNVVPLGSPGIQPGEMRAIKIVFASSREVYILGRNGNFATKN